MKDEARSEKDEYLSLARDKPLSASSPQSYLELGLELGHVRQPPNLSSASCRKVVASVDFLDAVIHLLQPHSLLVCGVLQSHPLIHSLVQ